MSYLLELIHIFSTGNVAMTSRKSSTQRKRVLVNNNQKCTKNHKDVVHTDLNCLLKSPCLCLQVHKVLAGSPADRDGRIQKGDRILSINGRSMKGVSHRESLAILKVLLSLFCISLSK